MTNAEVINTAAAVAEQGAHGANEWVKSAALIVADPRLETIEIDAGMARRARQLESAGYGAYDALHLSAAEMAQAGVLLTTGDGFVKGAARGDGTPRVPVRNPVVWLRERRL